MEIKVKDGATALACFDKETLELIAESLECVCECENKGCCDKSPCVEPNKGCCGGKKFSFK